MSEAIAKVPPLAFGAIADDITGASDLANTLVRGGLPTVLAIGVPERDVGDAQGVVVALKTRTIPAVDAVRQSMAAFRWLADRKAGAAMVKYCSTFDSTERGNIGQVVDAVLEASGLPLSVVCPAFPANKRTVYKGHLFVGDVPLHESSMRDHPLTPMRDASLVRLMARQTPHKVGLVPWETVTRGPDAIAGAFDDLLAQGVRHAVVDALTDQDLTAIAQSAWGRALLTGGSGIAVGIPAICAGQRAGRSKAAGLPRIVGPSIILAGSCSAATNAQVAAFKARGGRSYRIDPLVLGADPVALEAACAWVRHNLGEQPILIYSTARPEVLHEVQSRIGTDRAATLVEVALSRIASQAVEAGARRIVVAGGETSGAVMNELGVRLLRIGPEIDPGVPWTATLDDKPIALALKSGNFGAPDFFTRSFQVLP
jgi:uncharacterized protein YgbK (DUF1537 family)